MRPQRLIAAQTKLGRKLAKIICRQTTIVRPIAAGGHDIGYFIGSFELDWTTSGITDHGSNQQSFDPRSQLGARIRRRQLTACLMTCT
jgi:hypothetical protein